MWGETTVSAEGDAALAYGLAERFAAGRTMYHYTTKSGEAGIRQTGKILASDPEELYPLTSKVITMPVCRAPGSGEA